MKNLAELFMVVGGSITGVFAYVAACYFVAHFWWEDEIMTAYVLMLGVGPLLFTVGLALYFL